MRIAIPTTDSLKIVDTGGRRNGVAIFNSGPSDFFIEILQNQIDAVDPNSNIPSHGIKIAQNSAPFILPFFVGIIYARAAVAGAQGDVWQYCADC